MDNIKIERNDDFESQRKESILKGDYVMLEIIISDENPEIPSIHFVQHRSTGKTIAYLISTVESMAKELAKKFPMEKMYSDLFLRTKGEEDE